MPEEQVEDTAREVMPPVQFFNDDRMAVTEGLGVRDFSPKVDRVDAGEVDVDRGAPHVDDFEADTETVNADPDEDGDDDSPPVETPVEQPNDGDNGDDDGHARTAKPSEAKKPAKD